MLVETKTGAKSREKKHDPKRMITCCFVSAECVTRQLFVKSLSYQLRGDNISQSGQKNQLLQEQRADVLVKANAIYCISILY